MNNTIEQILFESERRRKMFHWLIDGLGSFHLTPQNKLVWISRIGFAISNFDKLTPDWVTKNYNVNI